MKTIVARTKKTHTTLKVFLICFAVYFVCTTYSK